MVEEDSEPSLVKGAPKQNGAPKSSIPKEARGDPEAPRPQKGVGDDDKRDEEDEDGEEDFDIDE